MLQGQWTCGPLSLMHHREHTSRCGQETTVVWAQAQFAPIRYARASGLAFQVLELLRRMNVGSVGFAITCQKKPGEKNVAGFH
jgi:hypothetical protein